MNPFMRMHIWSIGAASVLFLSLAGLCASAQSLTLAPPELAPAPSSDRASIWDSGVGNGFRHNAMELEFLLGAGYGVPIFGSQGWHDWAVGFVEFGWVFTDVLGRGRWYRGSPELLLDIFGGFQFEPDHAYLAGGTPLLRYNFATGTRWVPFINAGAGATSTDIRDGDLSSRFEFNIQVGGGTHYFLRDDLAFTVQYRFIHLSNAGMSIPNQGINSNTLLVGGSWFF